MQIVLWILHASVLVEAGVPWCASWIVTVVVFAVVAAARMSICASLQAILPRPPGGYGADKEEMT